MYKRIIKKSICLVTVWVFLLSQFAYASLYEDTFGLPSSKSMPTWNGSGWRNPKVEPLYSPEPPPIEPALLPPDDEEGDSTDIWGWLLRNVGPVLETGGKIVLAIVLAPFSLFTACSPPAEAKVILTPVPTTPTQQPPTPTPMPSPIPTPLSTPTPVPEVQIKGWIADLGSDDPKKRTTAALNLGTTGDFRAVEPLAAALEIETDFNAKCQEIYALGKLGLAHPRAVAILDKIVRSDENGFLRELANKSLWRIKLLRNLV